jgi:hypothetical protein
MGESQARGDDMDTVIEAAMAGAPRGMRWTLQRVSESGEPLGYLLQAGNESVALASKIGQRWAADHYPAAERIGHRYADADRAMVAVNLHVITEQARQRGESVCAHPGDVEGEHDECESALLDHEVDVRTAGMPPSRDPNRTTLAVILRVATEVLDGIGPDDVSPDVRQLARISKDRVSAHMTPVADVALLLHVAGYRPALSSTVNVIRIGALAALMEAVTDDEQYDAAENLINNLVGGDPA